MRLLALLITGSLTEVPTSTSPRPYIHSSGDKMHSTTREYELRGVRAGDQTLTTCTVHHRLCGMTESRIEFGVQDHPRFLPFVCRRFKVTSIALYLVHH
ncbi:hypothetical protein EDD16DRAFT_1577376 [Pisolithus croceorrhizus]|nr:hypothetical protein EDD16DRAFT_1577376 [Pisolithus croceorrhizus]KAI6123067.1 hypothetical protein EV401DRAFT_1948517 [Pisolithus croceorrhizus]